MLSLIRWDGKVSFQFLLTHACTKHIEIGDYNFGWQVMQHDLEIHYVSTKDQMVNIFTKVYPHCDFIAYDPSSQYKKILFC